MQESFSVRIKYGNTEFEVASTDRAFVETKITEYEAKYGTAKANQASIDRSPTGNSSSKPLSLLEFVRQVKPKSGPDHAVAVAYYVEKVENKGSFDSTDVKNGFLTIKYQHPNPTDAILKAKLAGRAMDGQSKGSFLLTQTGEEWVEQRLAASQAPMKKEEQ